MKHTCAYKYKLKLSSLQEEKAHRWMGVCRLIYNMALAISKESWEKLRTSPSRNDFQKQVTALRAEYDWIREVQSQVLQSPLMRLERAYQNFFKGAGYPKFAKKGEYSSFTFPQMVRFENGRFWLPKFGWVKVHKDRYPIGSIKQATVIYQAGQWYLSVSFEKEVTPLSPNENQVGLDLGVAHFVATSEGYLDPAHQVLKFYMKLLRIEQRSLKRKKKGGSNYNKQKARLAKLHQKIRRKRADHLHKLSSQLVSSYGTIVVEDLKLKNMSRSARGTAEQPGKSVKAKSGLNRSLLDAGIGSFVTMLEYKSLWYSRELIKVDPRYTSQGCASCGHVEKGNRCGIKFHCNNCGHIDHADVNAAKNILARAMANVPQREAVA